MTGAVMEETDERFLQTLYKGSELIGQGELEEARDTLETAVSMRPDDPKARNLLGLACFKLQDYPAAEALYQELVDENSEDATLRVNLGLVHLKGGRFEDAIRELAAAVELQPDHRRAQNYLGLAYARVGDYAQAQECFYAAGSPQMVERMERLISGEDSEDPEVAAVAPGSPGEGEGRMDVPEQPDRSAGSPEVQEGAEADGGHGLQDAASASGPLDEEAPAAVTEPGSAAEVRVEVEAAWAPADEAAVDEEAPAAATEPGSAAEIRVEVEPASAPPDEAAVDEEAPAAVTEPGSAAVVDPGFEEDYRPYSGYEYLVRHGTEADPETQDDSPGEGAHAEEPGEGAHAEEPGEGAHAEEPGEAPAVSADSLARQDAFTQDWFGGRAYEERAEEPPVPGIDEEQSGPPRSSLERWVLPARLLELADALALPAQVPAPFAVSPDVVVAAVDREMLSRMRGLLAIDGRLDLRPEVKRFRGRATEKPFGEGEGRMLRVSGRGRLYLATRNRFFTPVRADGADAYLSEDTLFAFEETVAYENGRVPSKVSPDLHLVHLRGRGVVLIETEGPLVSTQVTPGVPLRVPLDRLVGWTGLVTPRIVAFADEGGARGGPLAGVELAGEGRVLIALPRPEP